ncbi:hypothetical protein ACFCW2_05105 [Qipengyuania sp. DSG2-2]|uniref:hypothetical protein n=1 Tax=Qipengyuania sp. DGS2-2 TaxID=3349631 RepID=UPI0036D3E744
MNMQFSELARAVAADRHVSPEEILSLRRLGWGDGLITREEAEAIFAINHQIDDPDREWVDFFVEALTEFVLNGTEPKHMCDAEEADWLIAQLDADGQLETMAELELMVRVVERAQNVPEALKTYTLHQIQEAVLSGTGPTRCGGELSATHISTAECRLLRRVIFASGGYGPAAVTRHDAEMLFRIKDATLGNANALEWGPLFVDGIANYLKGFGFKNAQISHGRMKELEAFMNDNRANVGRFMGAMVREMPQAQNHFGKIFGRKQGSGSPDYTAQAASGELVTGDEKAWLDNMIEADGELDVLERELLDRLKSED